MQFAALVSMQFRIRGKFILLKKFAISVGPTALLSFESVATHTHTHTIFFLFLLVSVAPRLGPSITGIENYYYPGDMVEIGCVSLDSNPAPQLTWKLNGMTVWVHGKKVYLGEK